MTSITLAEAGVRLDPLLSEFVWLSDSLPMPSSSDETTASLQQSAIEATDSAATSKKKKNRKKKKTNKVRFSVATSFYFERAFGMDVVPCYGGNYPLGLGAFIESESISVDEEQERQQNLLQIRLSAQAQLAQPAVSEMAKRGSPTITKRKGSAAAASAASSKLLPAVVVAATTTTAAAAATTPTTAVLESRQFDYTHTPVLETERKLMLLRVVHEEESISHLNRDLQSIRQSREQCKCKCKPIKLDKIGVAKMRSDAVALGVCSEAEAEAMTKTALTSCFREFLKTYCSCRDPKSKEACECSMSEVECIDDCKCSKSCPNRSQPYDPEQIEAHRKMVFSSQRDS